MGVGVGVGVVVGVGVGVGGARDRWFCGLVRGLRVTLGARHSK